MTKKPEKKEEIELHSDGWKRFEKAVDAAVKSGPKHRKIEKAEKSKAIRPDRFQQSSVESDLLDEGFQEWEFYGIPVASEGPSKGPSPDLPKDQIRWLLVARLLETQGGIEIVFYQPPV